MWYLTQTLALHRIEGQQGAWRPVPLLRHRPTAAIYGAEEHTQQQYTYMNRGRDEKGAFRVVQQPSMQADAAGVLTSYNGRMENANLLLHSC